MVETAASTETSGLKSWTYQHNNSPRRAASPHEPHPPLLSLKYHVFLQIQLCFLGCVKTKQIQSNNVRYSVTNYMDYHLHTSTNL